MSLTKQTQKYADAIRASLDDGEVTGKELYINATDALEKSLEGTGLTIEQYRQSVDTTKRFATAMASVAADIGLERMVDNKELDAVIISAPISDNDGHTVRYQRVHEPVEGKPVYGHIQAHTAFQMDEASSSEFKKVSRAAGKAAKDAFADIE